MPSAEPGRTGHASSTGRTAGDVLDAVLAALTTTLLVAAVGMTGWAVAAPRAEAPETVARTVPAAAPVQLRVPSLGVRAAVVPITLGADAVLAPPDDPEVVGWWDGSAKPGATRGRVVLTGHTVHTGGGALDDLVDLDAGRVVLQTRTGPRTYRVTDRIVASYEEVAEHAVDVFGQRDDSPDGARLILVTCTDWNGSYYESNVIVVAEPV